MYVYGSYIGNMIQDHFNFRMNNQIDYNTMIILNYQREKKIEETKFQISSHYGASPGQ